MEEREISIKELVQVVWKGKFLIIILASIFMVLAFVGSIVMDNRNSQMSTIISLQWTGVTEGEYPDGTRFDYNTAIEAYVISLALEAQGIEGITTDEVRVATDMIPIVPSSVTSLIQTALENGEQISYYPTDYKIVMRNGDLDLTIDESRDLLNELVDQFRIDFERKYIQQSVILDFTDVDFLEYDYADIHTILETQVTLIDNAMNNRVELDPGFVSPTLGIGFADILVRTSLLTQLELSQIDSRTTTYLLTKDKDYLITNYTYQKDLKQLELDKATINVSDVQALINDESLTVDIIVIPGIEQDIEIDTYYSTLINNLVGLQQQVSELQNDIAYLDLQITRLNDVLFITPTKLAEEIAKVEASILTAGNVLGDIIEDSNTMLVEYNVFTTSNVIKPLMTPAYESNVSKLLYTAIGIILGAGIGTVAVLFKHDWE